MAAWAVLPDGRRLRGAAAISHILELDGGPRSRLGRAYRAAPIVRLIGDAVYRLVALNRSRLGWLGRLVFA